VKWILGTIGYYGTLHHSCSLLSSEIMSTCCKRKAQKSHNSLWTSCFLLCCSTNL